MAFDNDKLTIEIAAKNLVGPAFDQVRGQLERLNQSAQQTSGATSRLEGAMGGLKAGLAALPIAMVVAKLGEFHDATMRLAVRINDQSEALGLNSRQYQALQAAAAGAGVEESKMASAVSALNVKIGEAVKGKKEAIAAFDALGVKILDVNGKQRSEMAILEEVALKLSRVEDISKRAALAKDIFGQSGARLTAMLRTLGDGLERAATEAERAGLIMDDKTVKALEKLDRAGNEAGRQLKVLYAQFMAPIATQTLEGFTQHLKILKGWLDEIKGAWDRAFGPTTGSDIERRIASVQAERDRIAAQRPFATQPSELRNLDATIAALRAQQAAIPQRAPTSQGFGGPEPPPGTVSLGGARNPAVVGGGSTTDKAAGALAALQTQIREVNEAYVSLRHSAAETSDDAIRAAELHLRIETQLATTLRGIAANDPRREQIEQQTRVLETARQRYDDFKRSIQFADQAQRQFGDGSREHAITMRRLDEALRDNLITLPAYSAAVRAANDALQAQRDRVAEAQTGIQGFGAGFTSAMRQYERANGAFRQGQQVFQSSVQIMNDALVRFAETGEFSFKRILGSFASMLSQMALQAAASSAFKMMFGGSGSGGSGDSGILGSVLSVIGSVVGSFFAEGGRPELGRVSMVGERGPELFVPDTAGTIYNQRQIAEAGGTGGGAGVVIHQNFAAGTPGPTRAQWQAWQRETVELSVAAVRMERVRGGRFAQAFR